jgi:ferritin-like metal-binding protein YciE
MASPKENLVAWLKDAHALEQNVIQTLERHIDAAKDQPTMQVRMREHLQESRRHADLIEACLSRYGESISGLKETIGAVGGVMQGIATMPAADTLVKNALGDYAAEHFEIACYRSLITAARFMGDNETAQMCEGILRDEERMAAWFEQQIPLVTQEFLGLQARQVGR